MARKLASLLELSAVLCCAAVGCAFLYSVLNCAVLRLQRLKAPALRCIVSDKHRGLAIPCSVCSCTEAMRVHSYSQQMLAAQVVLLLHSPKS